MKSQIESEMSQLGGYQIDEFTTETAKRLKSKLENNRFSLLSLTQGTGKTYIAIKAVSLIDPNAHVLIISMAAKIQEKSWEASIDSFNEVEGTNITYGSMTFTKMKNPKHQKTLYDTIAEHGKSSAIIIFDEIQEIRNYKNTRKSIASANIDFIKRDKFTNIIGLSATPRPNDPFEMTNYLIMNGTFPNKTQVFNRYVAAYDDYHQPIYRNENDVNNKDELDKYIEDMTLYVESRDKLLPPITNRYITVKPHEGKPYPFAGFNDERHPFEDVEKRTTEDHYKQALKYYKKGWIESITSLNIMLMEIIAGCPMRKFALYQLLNEYFETPDATPVIICYEFNREKAAIEEVCEMAGITYQYINGQEKNQSEPENKRHAIILQYVAGGTGIELKFAHTMIFYMPTFKYNYFEQTKGRNVRRGMKANIKHWYMTTEKKRDFYAWQRVHRKEKDLKSWLESISEEELRQYL